MSQLGQVRIGHKAPDFHCEAVIAGTIRGMYLSSIVFRKLLTFGQKSL
jgi:peroxiredoxin (alkyl hydroperoxide reductase subunit C)